MGQSLFHSKQMTLLGEPIAWEQWARQGRTTVEHLRDLLRSGAAQPAQQQEMALLLDAMPAPWAAHIYGPGPQPTHLASADPADRRIFCPAADGQLAHSIQHCDAAAAGTVGSAHGGPGPASRPQASAGHRVRSHQAMASQPLSHPAPGATSGPTLFEPGQMALWTPGLGASRALQHMSTSSEPQPAACERCAASWQPSQTLSAPSGPSSGRPHMAMSTAASSGSRRWAARQAAQGQLAQPDQPEQPGPSRVRGAPDPSTDAPWMHPSRTDAAATAQG